jgi:hypothetical protein
MDRPVIHESRPAVDEMWKTSNGWCATRRENRTTRPPAGSLLDGAARQSL